jgi:hypothetical protein
MSNFSLFALQVIKDGILCFKRITEDCISHLQYSSHYGQCDLTIHLGWLVTRVFLFLVCRQYCRVSADEQMKEIKTIITGNAQTLALFSQFPRDSRIHTDMPIRTHTHTHTQAHTSLATECTGMLD